MVCKKGGGHSPSEGCKAQVRGQSPNEGAGKVLHMYLLACILNYNKGIYKITGYAS